MSKYRVISTYGYFKALDARSIMRVYISILKWKDKTHMEGNDIIIKSSWNVNSGNLVVRTAWGMGL